MSRSIKFSRMSYYSRPNFKLLGKIHQVKQWDFTLVGIDLSDVRSYQPQTGSRDINESLKVKHCGR